MRKTTGAIIAGLAALLLMGPANAQYPPDEETSCGVSVTVVPPGGSLTVSCGGFLPGSPWTITFFSQPEVLASGTVGADGSFSATVMIPGDASPGQHTLRVSGTADDGTPVVIDIPITVAGAAAAPGPLAVTGDNLKVGLLMLAGLLAAGTAVLLIGRRRGRVTR
ncbi:MAG TPA: hypothetical protein VHL78_10000 [Actinomycetota bacterium]|nr:hypothetical protein [Actinomycetota bacterium]